MAYDSENFIVSQSLPCAETGPDSPSSPQTPRLLDRDPKSLTEPRERLEYLRDFLRERAPVELFDMGTCGDVDDVPMAWCQTPSCIGGWGRVLFNSPTGIEHVGRTLLGLPEMKVDALFFPCGAGLPQVGLGSMPNRATPTQAANVLDHLIRTGEVRWDLA